MCLAGSLWQLDVESMLWTAKYTSNTTALKYSNDTDATPGARTHATIWVHNGIPWIFGGLHKSVTLGDLWYFSNDSIWICVSEGVANGPAIYPTSNFFCLLIYLFN